MYDSRMEQRISRSIVLISVGFAVFCPFSTARADCTPDNPAIPLCLSGTVTAPTYRGAVVEAPGKGERQVRPGDTIGDWTVGEIGARYIVFAHGTDEIRLDLANLPPEPEAAPAEPQPRGIKQGPMVHARSLARGGD